MKRTFKFNNVLNIWDPKYRQCGDGVGGNATSTCFFLFNVVMTPTYLMIEVFNFRFNFDLVVI